MFIPAEESLKETCKSLIETKLGWGSSDQWTNQDFDVLSEKIFDTTDVSLSQTTLKRIWGKVKYDSAPTVTTLNTLAKFLGFENWRDFRQKQSDSIQEFVVKQQEPVLNPSAQPVKSGKKFLFPVIAISLTLMSIVSWNFFSGSPDRKKTGATASFQFTSKKMMRSGVPNSVVFDYDASAAMEDSVFIQQSWDSRLRTLVSKYQHQHTSIYYYPGFFKAKLLSDGKIVKEHDIFIQTDGWLPLIEKEPVPVYFKKEDAMEAGKLSLPLAKIKSQNITMEPTVPFVFFANVREFGNLTSDNFIFETSVRNDYKEGAGICQKSEIRLLTEGSMVSIPLSAKGCISDNNLFCLGHFVKGMDHDLSGFGVDFAQFVKVRLEVKNGKAVFFVNDRMVYVIDGITMATKIKGIIYRFQGTGSVDWVRLSDAGGRNVYQEEF